MATGTTNSTTEETPVGTTDAGIRDQFIQRKLDRTRVYVKFVDLASSLMTLVAGLLVYLLALAIIDHWLFDLGTSGRWLALIGLLVGTGVHLFFNVLPPLVKAINPIYTAHAIEQTTPSLKNSLVNFLLFRAERANMPEAVYDAVESRAADDLGHVAIENAIDRSQMIHIGYVLAAVLAIVGAYIVLSPKSPWQTAGRVLVPWAHIERPIRVQIDQVEAIPLGGQSQAIQSDGGNVSLFHGQRLSVSARVAGKGSDEPVTLIYSTLDSTVVDVPIEMLPGEQSGRYECLLPAGDEGANRGVEQSLTYRIVAGDAETQTYSVDVLPIPSLIVKRIEYEYPSYTGMEPKTVEGGGDIRAIEGTRVIIHARASQSLRSAYLEFDPPNASSTDATGEASKTAPRKTVPIRQVDGSDIRVSILLALKEDRRTPTHESYQLRFVTEEGYRDEHPIRHLIEVTPDLPPRVEIIDPTERVVEVPENGQLEIKVRASDPDFALWRIKMHGVAGSQSVIDADVFVDEAGFTGQKVATHRFVPRQLDLKEGDEVRCWASAEDNRQSKARGRDDANLTLSDPPLKIRITAPVDNEGDDSGEKDPDQPGDKGEGDPSDKQEGNDGGEEEGGDEQKGDKGDEGKPKQGDDPNDSDDPAEQAADDNNKPKEDDQSNQDESDQGPEGTQGAGGTDESDKGDESQDDSGQGGTAGEDTDEGDGSKSDGNTDGGGQESSDPAAGDPNGGNPNSGEGGKPGDDSKSEPLDSSGADDAEAFDAIDEHRKEQQKNEESEPGKHTDDPSNDESADGDPSNDPAADNTGEPGDHGEVLDKDPTNQPRGDAPKETTGKGRDGAKDQTPGTGKDPRGKTESTNDVQKTEEPAEGNDDPSAKPTRAENDSEDGSPEKPGGASDDPHDGTGDKKPSDEDPAGDSNSGEPTDTDDPADPSTDPANGGKPENTQSTSDDEQGTSKPAGDEKTTQKPGKDPADSNASEDANQSDKPGNSGDQGENPTGDPTGKPKDGDESEQPSKDSDPKQDGNSKRQDGGSAPGDQQETDQGKAMDLQDKTNLDHARKVTDLVLDYLKDQQDDPDPELLDKLGWSKDDLQRFVNRWQQMKDKADRDHRPNSTAKRKLDDALESLGLRPGTDRVRRSKTPGADTGNQRTGGTRSQPPAKLRDYYKNFRKRLSEGE